MHVEDDAMDSVRTRRKILISTQVIEGARKVTKLTTGAPVAVRQPVYGPRAIEAVFGFTAVGGGVIDHTFDRDGSGTAADDVFLGDILGVAEKPVRLHTLATPAQFAERLAQCFGADDSFDDVLGAKLKDGLLALLAAGDKAECTSPVGLALLHQRVTGTLTPAMVACGKQCGNQTERAPGRLDMRERGISTQASRTRRGPRAGMKSC